MASDLQPFTDEFSTAVLDNLDDVWLQIPVLSGLDVPYGNIGNLVAVMVLLDLAGLPLPPLGNVRISTGSRAFAPQLRGSPRFFLEAQRVYFEKLLGSMRTSILARRALAQSGRPAPAEKVAPEVVAGVRRWDVIGLTELVFDGKPVTASTLGEWVNISNHPPVRSDFRPCQEGTLISYPDGTKPQIFAREVRRKGDLIQISHGCQINREPVVAMYSLSDEHPLAEWLSGHEPVADVTVNANEVDSRKAEAGEWAWMPSNHPLRLALLDEMKLRVRENFPQH